MTFLTGIPLKVEGEVSPSDLWGSMGWYPLVGLAMGFAAWVVYAGLDSFLPGLVAATLVVILLELLTRGLHLDGLMDTADGILSGAPRERALEIMKDHNVGAMGVASAVLLLVLKVAALGALARADAAAPLIAGLCAARALPALDVYHWPYARAAGTGEAFTREHTPGPLQLAGGCCSPASSSPAWPVSSPAPPAPGTAASSSPRSAWASRSACRPTSRASSAASPATSTAWASSSPRRRRWWRAAPSSGWRNEPRRHDEDRT